MDSFHEALATAVTDWLEQHTGVGLKKSTADKLVDDAILPLFAAKDEEIERLTAELERFTKGVTFTVDPRDAENERLRGVLRQIAEFDAYPPMDMLTQGERGEASVADMRDIARAALDRGEG